MTILGILAFGLACRLTTAEALQFDRTHASAVEAVLGEVRAAVSAECFEMADLYFHRGVGHQHPRAFEATVYERARAVVSPRMHQHLHGATEIREIMPWLQFALRADPRNIEAYLVAAFWLAHEGGHVDAAREVLLDGQRNNPYAVRIQLALGRLYVHGGQFTQALQAFNAALAFSKVQAARATDAARLDRQQGLLYRALLLEALGKPDQAIADLTDLLALAPEHAALAERRDRLRRGLAPEIPARELLKRTVRKGADARHDCAREHGAPPCIHDQHEASATHGGLQHTGSLTNAAASCRSAPHG